MTRRPTNNLPPGSQPWARAIEQDVDGLLRENSIQEKYFKTAFKTLATTLPIDLVNTQISLVNAQIGVDGKSNTEHGISLEVDAPAEKARITFTPPPWAKQAIAMSTGTINVMGPNLRAMLLHTRVYQGASLEGGSKEIYGPQAVEGASIGPYTGSVPSVDYLTDLTGEDLVFSVYGYAYYGDLGMPFGALEQNTASVDAVILYTR